MTNQVRVTASIPPAKLALNGSDADRLVPGNRFVPVQFPGDGDLPLISIATRRQRVLRPSEHYGDPRGTPRSKKDIDAAMRIGDFGVLFLERVRITPVGFMLGEHLLSLSLAPGEEVTVEQKTFAERQTTYEDVQENEEKRDSEFTSTLATEMTNALQQTRSKTDTSQFAIGGTGGFTYKGFSVSVSPNYSTSVSDADTETRNLSTKVTNNATTKLSAMFRAQHKVTIKVVDTERFERSSRRVLRNPNSYTPIDLVYFKVMQKLRFSQERFGIRLCWAPFVEDPGVIFDAAERAARQALEARFALVLPPEPSRPLSPGLPPPQTVSDVQELTKWGLPGDMSADYSFELAAPANYIWDDDLEFIRSSLAPFTTGWGRRGAPALELRTAFRRPTGVTVTLHAGADWGGPGATFSASFSARFIPMATVSDPAYEAAMAEWHTAHGAWSAEVAKRRTEADAAITAGLKEWRKEYWRSFDPTTAAVQLFCKVLTPPSARDEAAEIALWTEIFDFDNASYRLYPSWWAEKPLRDPSAGEYAFQNASWVRLFLPIRPEFEERALRWLATGSLHTRLPPNWQQSFDSILQDINKFRSNYFGGPDEMEVVASNDPCPQIRRSHLCLGAWTDVVPTDGTHLEVIAGQTTAIDDQTQGSLNAAADLAKSRLAAVDAGAAVGEAVGQKVSGSAGVDVSIALDPGGRA